MGSPTGLAKAVAAFCGGSNPNGNKNFEMVAFDHFDSIWSTKVKLALLKWS